MASDDSFDVIAIVVVMCILNTSTEDFVESLSHVFSLGVLL